MRRTIAECPAARRHVRGFGLLEAIVALALLAGTGIALFDWINSNLQAASRVRDTELRARLMLSAQAAVASVNPAQQPEGRFATGPLEVQWRAVLVAPERGNATQIAGAAGPWRIGLWRLEVQARDAASGVDVRFEQLQVGTMRTRPAGGV